MWYNPADNLMVIGHGHDVGITLLAIHATYLFSYNREQLSFLLGISYLWYTLIGFLIALIVGTLVSFATGAQDPSKLDPRLVWPFLRQRVGIKRV